MCFQNVKSNPMNITCGVPQGSILDPLLVWIYKNDLGTLSENMFSSLFTDDTSLLLTGHDLDVIESDIILTMSEVLE